MDLILRDAVVADRGRIDVGIAAGRIVALEPGLPGDVEEIQLEGRLVAPGFVETHIHLDKSCLTDRCRPEQGTLEEAIEQVAAAKREFTPEDVHARATRTIEKAIAHGTTHMRTHVEVDPVVGLTGIEGVLPLVGEYRWALDLELCVFPQEGLLDNPGTDELMVAALEGGASVVGAAPYTDSDPHGQIDRVFELAQEFDVDIDMHLDFGDTAEEMDTEYVCGRTDATGWGGRVTIGHVTKLSALSPARFDEIGRRLAGSGVAVTVLPSTDLFLMGRRAMFDIPRGVTPAHRLIGQGVNCSLSSNNVLNPFTPFGDCSLVRMANLVRERLPRRRGEGDRRVLRDGDEQAGQDPRPRRLRRRSRLPGRSRGSRLRDSRRLRSGDRAADPRLQVGTQDLRARAREAEPAGAVTGQADPLGAFVPGDALVIAPTGSGPLDGLDLRRQGRLRRRRGAGPASGIPPGSRPTRPPPAPPRWSSACLKPARRLIGKTITDELTYSITGENVHYGTPLNPRLPGPCARRLLERVCLGCRRRSRRLRSRHRLRRFGAGSGELLRDRRDPPDARPVSLDGVFPFAPSFDTVGWLAREPYLLERVGEVLLGGGTSPVEPDGCSLQRTRSTSSSRPSPRRSRARRLRRGRRRTSRRG